MYAAKVICKFVWMSQSRPGQKALSLVPASRSVRAQPRVVLASSCLRQGKQYGYGIVRMRRSDQKSMSYRMQVTGCSMHSVSWGVCERERVCLFWAGGGGGAGDAAWLPDSTNTAAEALMPHGAGGLPLG